MSMSKYIESRFKEVKKFHISSESWLSNIAFNGKKVSEKQNIVSFCWTCLE